MCSITFTDGSGAATLQPSGPASVSRFNNWTPDPDTIGERAFALGDGRLYQFIHRTDYIASFDMPRIPVADEAILQRFLLWAKAGGLFTVNTTDSASNSYSDCQLAPETQPALTLDREMLEYTLSLTIVHVAAVPTPLRCVYT